MQLAIVIGGEARDVNARGVDARESLLVFELSPFPGRVAVFVCFIGHSVCGFRRSLSSYALRKKARESGRPARVPSREGVGPLMRSKRASEGVKKATAKQTQTRKQIDKKANGQKGRAPISRSAG